MKLQALIFDWDGTIQDSMPEQYKGCCAVFNAAGIAPPSLEYFCQTLSMPFADWFISRGVTCFTDEERTRIFRSATNKEKCPLFPEAKEQLGIMRLNKVKLGIVTSARWPIINKLIEVHGLQGLFEAVTCEAAHKAEAIKQMCLSFAVPLDSALYVGDLTSDIRDGREAGVRTIAFLGSMGIPESFNDVKPDHCVKSFRELAELVLGESSPYVLSSTPSQSYD